jgi:hypothetical protein
MKIEKNFNYGGWENCIRLSEGEIECVVTTDVGPRIIRLAFKGEKNVLGEIEDHLGKTGGNEWLSYGGHRLWHSPEVMPRTYYPDNKPVSYCWDGKTLKLIQDMEETTGIQKEIEITPGKENNIRVLHRLINRNLWDIEFAPWAITVMAKSGRAIVPQEPYKPAEGNLLPVRPLVLWPYTRMGDHRFTWGDKFIQIKQDTEAGSPQKIGALNKQGWIAYSLGDYLFVKKYSYKPDVIYPDFGVNTEIYINPDILEMETLGSLEKVPPGGFVEHIENWFLFKEEIGEDEETLEKKLIPIIKKTDMKN